MESHAPNPVNPRPPDEMVRIPNEPIRLASIEKEILEKIRRRQLPSEADLVAIFPTEILGNFLIVASNPNHPRNNWSMLIERIEINGVTYYRLVHVVPKSVKDAWPPGGEPPEVHVTWGDGGAGQASRRVRAPIDPRTINWRMSDTEISEEMDRSRERIGQLRRALHLWSQMNWDASDEEVSAAMRSIMAAYKGRKLSLNYGLKHVLHYRALRDWLQQNSGFFRRSPRHRKQDAEARRRLQEMDTATMTLSEIKAALHKEVDWIKRTLQDFGKPYKIIEKKNAKSRWGWPVISDREWETLTAKKISELVTDDKGNHPSEEVVNSYRWRRRRNKS